MTNAPAQKVSEAKATAASPAAARPPSPVAATRPAAPLPAAVQAEIAQLKGRITAAATKPDAMAQILNEWIDKHTAQQPMNSTIKENLGSDGKSMEGWMEYAANKLPPALLGKAAAQDVSSGVTRALTKEHVALYGFPLPRRHEDFTRDTLNTGNHTAKVLEALLRAVPPGQRTAVDRAFRKLNGGKSLSATLGELIRDSNVRAPLMALLPPPIDTATLTLDTFLEQIAVGMVYSNQTAEELNTDEQEERRKSSPAALLAHFGYRAGPLILGRWGFQMRVFTPVPGKGKWPPVVAFRGTEGVQFDLSGDKAVQKAKAEGRPVAEQAQARALAKEGTVDTVIGDVSPTEVGWLQVKPNTALIEQNLNKVKGKAISTGHSLGGAIAQLVAATQPDHFGQVVTFQAANIDRSEVNKLRRYNETEGKDTPVMARHYRAEGDVVPTAGEQALDGEIFYFDRVTRPAGSTGPFSSAVVENVAASHVTPLLTTYVRGQKTLSPELQFLASKGMRDEATLNAKQPKQVQNIFSGSYSTAQDPRIVAESQRKLATSHLNWLPGEDPFEATFYANIAYNTLLSHIENLLDEKKSGKKITSLEEFRKQAEALLSSTAPLSLDPDDVELAKVLKMDHYEKDYESKPVLSFPGPPTYPMKATPIVDYLKDGVKIPKDVIILIRSQLNTIWSAWRGK